MKIRKDDNVLVTAGKDRGKKGKVLRGLPESGRLLIEGVNIRKKHVRPKKQGEKGQVVEVPGPVDASNVKLICPGCKKATRIGHMDSHGKKVRVCKKCQKEIA